MEECSFDGYSLSRWNKDTILNNFSPGPAAISRNVIQQVMNDLSTYGNTPLEISHRSPEFGDLLERTNRKLRAFMNIPDEFVILWTHGGGHGQFSAVPLNMKALFPEVRGEYLVTGTWSAKAFREAQKFIQASCTVKTNGLELDTLPSSTSISLDADYVYLCSNETVNGLEFRQDGRPLVSRAQLNGAKLVVDMSSDFMTKRVDWCLLDVAFACTSKNLGAAGANILIVRKHLLDELDGRGSDTIPCTLDWSNYYKTDSLYNTPATFNIYLVEQVLDQAVHQYGTIERIEQISREKARIVYTFLDQSRLFRPVVSDVASRSNLNIPFWVGHHEATRCAFLKYCHERNIVGLRTKTPFPYERNEPLRVSLYNGVDLEQVHILVETMRQFELTCATRD